MGFIVCLKKQILTLIVIFILLYDGTVDIDVKRDCLIHQHPIVKLANRLAVFYLAARNGATQAIHGGLVDWLGLVWQLILSKLKEMRHSRLSVRFDDFVNLFWASWRI